MAFATLNSILSTAVSITYTCCCAIVLMLHNGLGMVSLRPYSTDLISKTKTLNYEYR